MPFDYGAAVKFLAESALPKPIVKGWNRLEGRPRAVDFERALRAEVRDALWFLTRQWQFGEFHGEDAASPIEARTLIRTAPFVRYAAADGPPSDYDRGVPLEARVEAEPVAADLPFHVAVSRYFFRRLRTEPNLGLIRSLYVQPAAYGLSATAVEGELDADGAAILSVALPHTLDGRKLLADVASGAHDTAVEAFPGLNAAERTELKQAGLDLAIWLARLYLEPGATAQDAWVPRFLEYQFACAARGPVAPAAVVTADRYDQGRLDWYSFNVDVSRPQPLTEGLRLVTPAGEPTPPEHSLSFIPAPVTFGGMPNPRYWEFESRKTEFGAIDANTTDLATLLLSEFALVYSNDWCVIPYVVEVGSLCDVVGLLVVDDFGETSLIRAAGRGRNDAWQRWSMFSLSTNEEDVEADVRLLIPPVLPKSMAGDPVESVVFLRDEMANMAWAVERIVPSARGEGVDGYTLERGGPAPTPAALHPTVAPVRYRLGTDVPLNWHPFVPVHISGSSRSVQLQRARMPDMTGRDVRGRLIAGPSPFLVNEEEIGRAGKNVRRAFQRARWLDGRPYLWVGRQAITGRGEGSSGLAFDQLEELREEGS